MKLTRILYRIIIALLLVIFLTSAAYVGIYVLDSKKEKQSYDKLSQLVEEHREVVPTPQQLDGDDTVPTAPTEQPMLTEYAPLYELNPDTVGWLKIEGTNVDYPVMHTPNRKEYYLTRNFEREEAAHGCLFIQEECDVNAPSDNITIYGHHMVDGSMFGSLDKFRKKDYWEEHRTLRFDTLYEHHTYEIFAVFRTTASIGEGFAYHAMVDALDEADFNDFITTMKGLAEYDTGIFPEYGDKIICLSTCEYSRTNGRLVVAAVRKE